MTDHLVLSPQGRIFWRRSLAEVTQVGGQRSPKDHLADRLGTAFADSSAAGLFELVQTPSSDLVSPEFAFWRRWGLRLFESLCQLDHQQRNEFSGKLNESTLNHLLPAPDELQLAVAMAEAPPMPGLEYLTPAVMSSLWRELLLFVYQQVAGQAGGLVDLLQRINPNWQLLGRVTFHLAENRKDPARPFAFLATYAHQLSGKSGVKHLPLAEALRQYANRQDQEKLAELLAPVRLAAEQSTLIKNWLESRALFQAQSLAINQAYEFLQLVPILEKSGLAVRVPDWWRARQSSRPTVTVQLGNQEPQRLGARALLSFSVDLAMDGSPLSAAEQAELLRAEDGLLLLRGKWVEVDRSRLNQALQHWQELKSEHLEGVDFLRAMRLLSGTAIDKQDQQWSTSNEWSRVTAGPWLEDLLQTTRAELNHSDFQPGQGLQATLRPYQVQGVRWLWLMAQLQLGACLADDMGLGKTIQIIDLIWQRRQLSQRKKQPEGRAPSLLIVPASLLGNWKQEFTRFAPQLKILLAHRSEMDTLSLQKLVDQPQQCLAGVDVVVTSYTMVRNFDWISQIDWDLIVLDEAQAIKNASSSQTRSVKKLKGACRIVLTGTPVENQLGDLWSLFDFCCPGLLGTAQQFKDFVKRIGKHEDGQGYGSLRRLVQPYLLRRMKTDPRIAPDLPEKTEMRVECGLSKRQATLYQKIVDELAEQLETMGNSSQGKGMRRRGIVLSAMMQLKQLCNHPAQLNGGNEFSPAESGKFQQLAEIGTSIGQRQEKTLVFTQFQAICQPLADYLQTVFGDQGLVLHGGTPVKQRKELVKRFQEDESIPFFVISLKAGGTGLNLTAASHVIHFDRWWNPAVENQATDRAFRIGQQRNVLVHKFVCRGTLEERIDQLISSKQALSDAILGPSQEGERLLTEMNDQELLEFVKLDVRSCELSK